ncbi:disulfide bond formation protein D [Mycobacteroides abscessus subsp. abscessus]|nr:MULTISPECIES: thioredoxin domain-containing protein [Mycobacteroides]KKC00933.1 hypothetical protein WR43_03155 [Mycolicibacter arupensis]SHT87826.1 putative thiol-disulfide oxidoreductase [Mycobacteroides abscessus subsp. bolletii]SKK79979.1 disulfide bond formation protein D [Mycobacteroides abscessus subsp. massiliense]MBN7454702.1 DsbA family protein [Mycobacteroides abscessus subsp. abscessus]MBV6363284.1 DsbA family protein [Mycobacteroides chelonae]
MMNDSSGASAARRPRASGTLGRRLAGRARWWLGALSVVAVVVVLAVAGIHHSSEPQTQHGASRSTAASSAIQTWRGAHQPSEGDALARGSVSAPVVVAEWGDFQCPFCRAFDLDSQPVLIGDYVQTGKVRFEWHDLAKLGPESVLAARGARAAARQGAFWAFHDAFYRDQAPENSGAVTEQSLMAMARNAGLDVDRFVADLADPAIADAVERDRSDARQLGITHVPSFLVNDELLIGAQSLDTLRRVIDAAAVKAP